MCVHHTMYLTHLSGLFTFMLMLKHINAFVTLFSYWFLTLSLSLSLSAGLCATVSTHQLSCICASAVCGRCLSVSVCVCVCLCQCICVSSCRYVFAFWSLRLIEGQTAHGDLIWPLSAG